MRSFRSFPDNKSEDCGNYHECSGKKDPLFKYCKKLIAVLPKQNHPEQYHQKKEETFHVLYGDDQLYLNGELQVLGVGDAVTIKPEVRHSFTTNNGCVIEEISSTHYKDDSYYTDKKISQNKNRKTFLKYWL